jgi:hypothetical protein
MLILKACLTHAFVRLVIDRIRSKIVGFVSSAHHSLGNCMLVQLVTFSSLYNMFTERDRVLCVIYILPIFCTTAKVALLRRVRSNFDATFSMGRLSRSILKVCKWMRCEMRWDSFYRQYPEASGYGLQYYGGPTHHDGHNPGPMPCLLALAQYSGF